GTLMPADGTKARERLVQLGRVKKASYYEADLYSELVIHPSFEPGQLVEAVFDGYNSIYEKIGPAIHRWGRTWFTGARRFKNSPNRAPARRSEVLGQRSIRTRAILLNTLGYLPNDAIRDEVKDTLGQMRDFFGPPTPREEAEAALVAHAFATDAEQRASRAA